MPLLAPLLLRAHGTCWAPSVGGFVPSIVALPEIPFLQHREPLFRQRALQLLGLALAFLIGLTLRMLRASGAQRRAPDLL